MKVYIYPTYTPSRDKSGNLYIKCFHESFEKDGNWSVVNRCWQIGIASILMNLDAKVFIIQWVDLIPGKKFGKIQFFIFLMMLYLLRGLGKNIVLILHNKYAHNGKSKLVDWGMKMMARFSNQVIAHSEEGISFFDAKYPRYKGKCSYIPHPVYTSEMFPSKLIKWDYVIWGNISPRKQVLDFLQYAKTDSFFADKRILVCGRCPDEEYARLIQDCCAGRWTFEDRFLSDEELEDRIASSRAILFTYKGDSVLSSGALIYSLNFNKPIIGPRVGSFADLKGIVTCYEQFNEIPNIELASNQDAIAMYIEENTWLKFPQKVERIIAES